MNSVRSFLWTGAAGITLLVAACQDEELPTSMNPAVGPLAKPVTSLKVTPTQISLAGTGAVATLTVSQFTGSVNVAVSTPACVSVVFKASQKNQDKYSLTATAPGSCTITVTDGGGSVQVPVVVAGIPLLPAKLAAGAFHTCGLDVNGAAYCWGNNPYGQLGNSTNLGLMSANPTPTAVDGGLVFASLTAGNWHTCGLTPAGSAYCWGANWSGQLGNATNSGVSDVSNPAPLPAAAGLTFSTLEAAGDHTCGITTQGAMYCWGSNSLGQLTTTVNLNTGLPNVTPILVSGTLTFTTLAAGSGHTCGVTTSGATYCWGANFVGQLGNGTVSAPVTTPALVPGLPALALIISGTDHTCGLTPAGAAWCWGQNSFGELSGTTDNPSPTPVAVSGGLAFTTLGAGVIHSCGRTSGGTVYCWGGNAAGQLGSAGDSNPHYSPMLVGGLNTAVAITASGSHSCALTTGGQAYCWGDNRYGQLGNPTNNNTGIGNPTPALVSGVTFATP